VVSFLVLWDVDFTLVDSAGVGRYLYQVAFAQLYGRELPASANEANFAGRTDRAIALDVLALAGVPDPLCEVARFEAALAELAPGLAAMVAASAKPLPGAMAAMKALADTGPGLVVQSLLTGNVRPLAEVKLAPLGLTRYLDLDVGAYGDEHAVRAELVPHAQRRARAAYEHDFGGEATVLIGDTPHDVRAALVNGARAIAVATGFSPADELAAAGAHAVLGDLSDTSAVLAAILAPVA
jgi:phosphoglycolate phosphatase